MRHITKVYTVKFLLFFKLEIISEDRDNGEHKHFIDIYFLNKRLLEVCYRTGSNNYYMGYVCKEKLFSKKTYLTDCDGKHPLIKSIKKCRYPDNSSGYNYEFKHCIEIKNWMDEKTLSEYNSFYNLDDLCIWQTNREKSK